MAAFDFVSSVYDPALKPRLLRMLLREHVPDEKRTIQDTSELLNIVSMIKTHNLLSESLSSVDQKVIDSWKFAVDSWVGRLILLLSSNTPDKCWAGIVLLGVTCQQCSPTRFLASYTEWFHKLLPQIQTDSQFLKVASCASISDLFSRLSGFQNVKKDGTSQAGKIIQPVLKLLHDENTEAVWDAAVNLLSTLISFFPFSVQRHYDSAEAAIVSKILSGKCSFNMLKKLAHCLALLPKSKGDEDRWALLMQKILLSINGHLNEVFHSVDEDSKGYEVRRLLVPPGRDPPPPLGCNSLLGDSYDKITKDVERLLTSSVSTLMLCCSTMITSSYPYPVVVPVRPLLVLVERVLMVDGSLPPTSLPVMTAFQQESLCSELPTLHSDCLDLLTAIIKSLRSQLLPHAASIVRLISVYFKKCVSAELRVKVYAVSKLLMMTLGIGMAAYLAQDVIDNVLLDLNPADKKCCAPSSENVKDTKKELLQHHKKRKRISVATSLQEQHDKHGSGWDATNSHIPTPVTLSIAALEALETLLTSAGALRFEGWRAKIDNLLITTATSSFRWPWAMEENFFQSNESPEVWTDYQLAAFRALLASFLSAVHIRPLYLAQGLELFRRGKQEAGTKLAELCAHALLAMEVLIHPRVLPLSDYSPANLSSLVQTDYKISEDTYFKDLSSSKSLNIGTQEPSAFDSDDDDLYDRWVADGIEEAAVIDEANETNGGETMYNKASKNDPGEEKNSRDGSASTVMHTRDEQETAATISADNLPTTETPSASKNEQEAVEAMADVDVIYKSDVFANAGMNSSPMSPESDGNEEYDFPDIIDADPDLD